MMVDVGVDFVVKKDGGGQLVTMLNLRRYITA